jgi:Fe(3+) dicitrate transport protein
MMLARRTLAMAAIIALSTGAAAAQEPGPPVIAIWVDVEEVLPSDATTTPGAHAVFTDADRQALRPSTLHDALAFTPGVRTIDDDVLGRRSGIAVRGAPARRSRKTLLLEDGTPINASTYLDPSAHYTPPLERLERVDVLKGTGHIVNGPLNNHGIINFRNKQPTAQPETTLELGAGNLGTFTRHLMHRRTNGPLGVVLSYTGANADGAFDVEGHRFDDLFGSVDWRLGPRQQLGFSTTVFRERSHYDESNLTPEEFAVAPRTKQGRFGQEYNTLAVDYRKLNLVHRFRAADGIAASTRLFVTDLDRPRFTVDPGDSPRALLPAVRPEDPFVRGESGTMVSRDRHYRTVGLEHRMERAWRAADGRGHALQWGARAEVHRLDDRRGVGGAGEVLDADTRGVSVRDEAYRSAAASLFVQDALHRRDWVATGGLRLEHYTQSRQRRASRDLPAGEPRETDANTLVLPSVGLLYTRWRQTPIFANVGRGYTPAFARTAADFPLEPETGVNAQIGVRSTAVTGLSVEAALFHNWIRDTVIQLPFTIDNQNVYLNSEHSRAAGLDLGARLNSAPFTNGAHNLFAQVAWTYTRATFTDGVVEGRWVPEVPRHSGSATIGIEHRSGLRANLTLSYLGAFFTDPANTVAFTAADEDGDLLGPADAFDLREPVILGRVPSRTLLSATVDAPLPGSRWTLWVHGRNLTNRLYITDLANGLRPGAARTVSLGVRLALR